MAGEETGTASTQDRHHGFKYVLRRKCYNPSVSTTQFEGVVSPLLFSGHDEGVYGSGTSPPGLLKSPLDLRSTEHNNHQH